MKGSRKTEFEYGDNVRLIMEPDAPEWVGAVVINPWTNHNGVVTVKLANGTTAYRRPTEIELA